MMPSSPKQSAPHTRYSCWLVARSVQERVGSLNWQPLAPQSLSHTAVRSPTAARATALCHKSILAIDQSQPSQSSRPG